MSSQSAAEATARVANLGRAGLLLASAAACGVYLTLNISSGGPVSSERGVSDKISITVDANVTGQEPAPILTEDSIDTAEVASTVTASTAVTVTPAQIMVVVLNGAEDKEGIAASGTKKVTEAGYKTMSPRNASNIRPSAIYYTEGHKEAALEVVGLFGVGLEKLVNPLNPADPPAAEGHYEAADIVIVLGNDNLLNP